MTDDIALKAIMAAVDRLVSNDNPDEFDADMNYARTTVQDALAYAGAMGRFGALADVADKCPMVDEGPSEWLRLHVKAETTAATLREKLEGR